MHLYLCQEAQSFLLSPPTLGWTLIQGQLFYLCTRLHPLSFPTCCCTIISFSLFCHFYKHKLLEFVSNFSHFLLHYHFFLFVWSFLGANNHIIISPILLNLKKPLDPPASSRYPLFLCLSFRGKFLENILYIHQQQFLSFNYLYNILQPVFTLIKLF